MTTEEEWQAEMFEVYDRKITRQMRRETYVVTESQRKTELCD